MPLPAGLSLYEHILTGCFHLFDSEILLGYFDAGRIHVMSGIAHDIGILIYKEDIVRLYACLSIRVIGTVPLRVRGEYLISFRDIIDLVDLAVAVDYVDSMLCKTCGYGVAIGICPCSELACAAFFHDCSFNLGKNLLEIAGFLRQVDSKSSRIAHQRGRKVSFDEISAVSKELLQQRLGMSERHWCRNKQSLCRTSRPIPEPSQECKPVRLQRQRRMSGPERSQG